jgi:hypothetical protein
LTKVDYTIEKEQVTIHIATDERHYSWRMSAREVALCYNAHTLENETVQIEQLAVDYHIPLNALHAFYYIIPRAAFTILKDAMIKGYCHIRPMHDSLNAWQKTSTIEFDEQAFNEMTYDNPCDLQVLTVCLDDMQQEIGMAYYRDLEIEKMRTALRSACATALITYANIHRCSYRRAHSGATTGSGRGGGDSGDGEPAPGDSHTIKKIPPAAATARRRLIDMMYPQQGKSYHSVLFVSIRCNSKKSFALHSAYWRVAV